MASNTVDAVRSASPKGSKLKILKKIETYKFKSLIHIFKFGTLNLG
jgi:hypothetical protein